jgi:hypothetical protein
LVTYEKKGKEKATGVSSPDKPQASSKSGLASSFGGVVTITKDELELAPILAKTSAYAFPS